MNNEPNRPRRPFQPKPANEPYQPGELSPARAPGPGMQVPQTQTKREDGSSSDADVLDSDDRIAESGEQARETD
jgi:hypothetical protein